MKSRVWLIGCSKSLKFLCVNTSKSRSCNCFWKDHRLSRLGCEMSDYLVGIDNQKFEVTNHRHLMEICSRFRTSKQYFIYPHQKIDKHHFAYFLYNHKKAIAHRQIKMTDLNSLASM